VCESTKKHGRRWMDEAGSEFAHFPSRPIESDIRILLRQGIVDLLGRE